jgi:transcriptional regulator with XRE-family HTH domain
MAAMPAERKRKVVPESGQRKLAAWREYRGWTQNDLSRYTGIPQRTIAHMESSASGKRANVRLLIQCALALRCNLDDLIEDEWREWQVLDVRATVPPAESEYRSSLEPRRGRR